MRRLLATGLSALFLTVSVVIVYGYSDIYMEMNLLFWILFILRWTIGLVMAIAGALLLPKLFKLDHRSWSGQNIRTTIFSILLVSWFFALEFHMKVILKLSNMLFQDALTDTFEIILPGE